MADIIQQRRDTAARWAQYNPILMEGEVGYVTDNPNQYKIGNGRDRWNNLPLRGYTGTITQDTGDDENAVMSQKAVSEKLSELGSETSLNRFNKATITTGKWQQASGAIITSADFFISDYIPVKEGEVMFCTHGQDAACTIAQYDSSKKIITGTSQYFPTEGVAIVSGAKYILVSAETWVLGNMMVASNRLPVDYWNFETASKPAADLFYNRIPKAYESKEEQMLSSLNRFNKNAITADKWQQPSGAIASKANSFISEYIPVNEGETICCNYGQGESCTIAQYDASKKLISGTSQYFPTNGVIIAQGAAFVIVSAAESWVLGTMMVTKGNVPNIFVPYIPNSINSGYSINNRYFEQIDTPIISKLVAISSVFEDGIFGGNLNSGFETSDYIEVTLNNAENYYFICKDNYSASALRFFDKDKNLIVAYKASDLPKEPIKLTFGDSVQYVRFARTKASATGVYRMPIISFEEAVNGVVKAVNTENNNVLWLGTSIPEGATYPKVACQNNGYNCINKAKGSSKLGWYESIPSNGDILSGRSLTASVAELEAFYRPYVTNGTISESTLESWKQGSYENSVLPYINGMSETQVSMIVIDHGYNDHSSINELIANKDNIDWNSTDKGNFVGAFHFLVNEIQKIKPFIKIVISGYFQNTGFVNGVNICEIQQMIANQYRFQLMDAWNYTQIGQRGFIEGTSNYIENLNAKYGTSFNVPDWAKDSNGNIIALKMYCPDNIHPHSDPTGNTNKRLNAVYTKLLANSI